MEGTSESDVFKINMLPTDSAKTLAGILKFRWLDGILG